MKKKIDQHKKWIIILSSLIFITLCVVYIPRLVAVSVVSDTATTTAAEPVKVIAHVETPKVVRGIYMTACVASVSSWRTDLKKFIENTELNTVLIDIKDYSGTISFSDKELQPAGGTGCMVKDLEEYIAELHKSGIYVLGRIAVFQDPLATKLHPEWAVKSKSTGGVWKDHKGLSFIDVGATEYWDYIVQLAKKSYAIGFDEINFDYIRYPSDGNMKDTNFTFTVGTSTKADMLENFFKYLSANLKGTGMKTSVDLFGMTTTSNDDLGIGQVLVRTLPYFDYVLPMVYPSHYPATWEGLANPAANPYQVIKISMKSAVDREQEYFIKNGIATSTPSKLRPWLQDFDLGATYGVAEVRAQMKGAYDVGLTSWMSWDAGNKYTRDAYLPETSTQTRVGN